MWRCAAVLLAVSASVACGSPASPSTPLSGVWGGDHISLTATGAGSHAEFDCAHGDTPSPLVADVHNGFAVIGTFVREHGGPIQVGAAPDSHPAMYSGSVNANTMVMTIQLTDTQEVIGTFTLLRDTAGRVVKCLLPSKETRP
jgi:hypothetical protein